HLNKIILIKQEDLMEVDHIKNEVKLFLLNSFRIKDIGYSDNIFDTGAMHSLFFIQLLVFIEKKYKIDLEVGEFDLNQLTSIDAIAHFISSKL
ncbi:phosphopantetheine-binding protein, partial [Legionella pneumophila]|nr:phosphopantetheine-binding protein [Legionella pneumophila]